MKTYKERNGTTQVGDFLRGLGDVAKPILKAAGGLTGQEWITNIAANITTSKELSQHQKDMALVFLQLDAADRADARSLQKATLAQDDIFSKRFIYYLAGFWSIIGALFILIVCFYPIPKENTRLIDTITGFLLSGIIMGIITYFFGSSAGSEKKNQLLSLVNQKK